VSLHDSDKGWVNTSGNVWEEEESSSGEDEDDEEEVFVSKRTTTPSPAASLTSSNGQQRHIGLIDRIKAIAVEVNGTAHNLPCNWRYLREALLEILLGGDDTTIPGSDWTDNIPWPSFLL